MLEDRQLVYKLKRGDGQALRRLYLKYKDSLYTVAASLLNDKNEAEKVLHDAFMSFTEKLSDFHTFGSSKRYLVVCVINQVRSRFRDEMYSVEGLENNGPIQSSPDKPEQTAISNDIDDLLAEALAQLPLPQREVVVLYLQAKMKFKEIAAIQEVSINTVQSRYRYGLEKLREFVNTEVLDIPWPMS